MEKKGLAAAVTGKDPPENIQNMKTNEN